MFGEFWKSLLDCAAKLSCRFDRADLSCLADHLCNLSAVIYLSVESENLLQFLLRDPRQKIPVWQDLKQVMKVFGKTPPTPPARQA